MKTLISIKCHKSCRLSSLCLDTGCVRMIQQRPRPRQICSVKVYCCRSNEGQKWSERGKKVSHEASRWTRKVTGLRHRLGSGSFRGQSVAERLLLSSILMSMSVFVFCFFHRLTSCAIVHMSESFLQPSHLYNDVVCPFGTDVNNFSIRFTDYVAPYIYPSFPFKLDWAVWAIR